MHPRERQKKPNQFYNTDVELNTQRHLRFVSHQLDTRQVPLDFHSDTVLLKTDHCSSLIEKQTTVLICGSYTQEIRLNGISTGAIIQF